MTQKPTLKAEFLRASGMEKNRGTRHVVLRLYVTSVFNRKTNRRIDPDYQYLSIDTKSFTLFLFFFKYLTVEQLLCYSNISMFPEKDY